MTLLLNNVEFGKLVFRCPVIDADDPDFANATNMRSASRF